MGDRLRLTQDSLKVVADWNESRPPPQWRERVSELLRSFEDGSWDQRRYPPLQYSTNPDVFRLDLDTHLHVFYRVFLDGDDEQKYADVFDITNSGSAVDEYGAD